MTDLLRTGERVFYNGTEDNIEVTIVGAPEDFGETFADYAPNSGWIVVRLPNGKLMPVSRQFLSRISDAAVKYVANELFSDTLGVIAAMKPELRAEYTDTLHNRVRDVMTKALSR